MYKFVSFALIVSDSFELKKKQSMWSLRMPNSLFYHLTTNGSH